MNLYSTHVVKRNLNNRNQKFKKYEKKKETKIKKIYLEKRVVRPTHCKTHCSWARCRQITCSFLCYRVWLMTYFTQIAFF